MNTLKWLIIYTICALVLSGCASIQPTARELSDDGDFKVQILQYNCESDPVKAADKTLLIMPPTGGTNYIDQSYAKQFCKAGFEVYIIESWTGMLEKNTDLGVHQRLYTRAQKAMTVTLQQVKSPFIGLLGTSVGAMHAAVASNQQPRINAIFSILGGIPITNIIITSDQKAMIDLKQLRQQKLGIKNDDDYQNQLGQAFHLEPSLSGELFKSKKFGAVVATQDETVPTKNQNQLVEFWRPETVITLNNDHFWGIVKTWMFHSDEVLDFFQRARQTYVDISKVRQ